MYSKRGEKLVKQLEKSPSVQKIVNEIAEGIANDKMSPFDAMLQFCKLCEALRSDDLICGWHKEITDLPASCTVCPTETKKN